MTDLPEPIATFIDAVNRHDEQAFLAAFTESGFVNDWGRVFTGSAEIKAWSDNEFLGANGTLSPQQVIEGSDSVVVIGDWRSTHANGVSRFEFSVDQDKIGSMTISEG